MAIQNMKMTPLQKLIISVLLTYRKAYPKGEGMSPPEIAAVTQATTAGVRAAMQPLNTKLKHLGFPFSLEITRTGEHWPQERKYKLIPTEDDQEKPGELAPLPLFETSKA
jgi:hypothetical protein